MSSSDVERSGRFRLSLACWLGFMAQGVGFTVLGPLVTVLEEQFETTKAVLASVLASSAAGFLVCLALGGILLARLGPRRSLLIGSGGFGIALVWLGLAPSLDVAALCLAVMGFTGGLLQLGANAAVARSFPENRALHLNLLHLFFGIGAVAGPRLVPWVLAAGLSWRHVFYRGALLSALAFGAALLGPRAPPARETPTTVVRNGLSRPVGLLRLQLLMACYVGAEVSLHNWGPAYMEQLRGLTLPQASSNLSNFWLAMTLGRLACARLSRRLSPERLLRGLSLGALTGAILFLAWPSPAGLAWILPLAGLFFSGVFPTVLAIAGDADPRRLEAITARLMLTACLGSMAFPWLVGTVGSLWGLGRGLLLMPGLLLLVALLGWRPPAPEPRPD